MGLQKAVQPANPTADGSGPRVQQATTSIEDLSKMFTKMLLKDPEHSAQSSIEGLAYASIRPRVKEELSKDKTFLKQLVKTLETAPAKSALTYGALSILVNMTVYRPTQSEEQKRMNQLKAYANAAGKLQEDPLNDHAHATERCKRVYEAGVVPVLVSHSKYGSLASLSLIITIIHSLSTTISLRGNLAQQGAVRLLIAAWTALPEAEVQTRRTAAQALARVLITTNPTLVFGGNRPIPQSMAIRPLTSILLPDPNADTRDLLPTFEALMALTNLASTDDDTRTSIVRAAWPAIEDVLLSTNARVTTAAVELICNLVLNPAEALALFGDGKPRSLNRLRILVALADAEDAATRSAAGGALASLTAHEGVVRALLTLDRGMQNILSLCRDESDDLRHRGAFVVFNMLAAEGDTGRAAKTKLLAAGAVAVLTECAKKSRRAAVVEVTVQALQALLEQT